jgi:ABC-type uncharacterized transport system ATPase subunit
MLELRQITKRFGNVLANDHVDLMVAAGTIHAVIGENGAGKSTAMRIAYGFYHPDSGEVVIDGQPVRLTSPHDAIARGVGMVHQHFMLVDTMTVAENIVLGAEPGQPLALDIAQAQNDIKALADRYHFAITPGARIEDLSVGQQQRVELLKALYRDARLLILDEPTAVLTPQEVEELFGILRRMREQGKTVVIITHKLGEVMAISDEVTVMRDGRVVGRRKTSETNPAELARLMVGREVLLRVEKQPAKPAEGMLQVRDLVVTAPDGTRRVDGISLEVRAGEIVGIAGVEGNGQTELVDALSGVTPADQVRGEIRVGERSVSRLGVRRRKELGVSQVPEDRHRRGLVLEFDLQDNSVLGAHYRNPLARGGGWMDRVAIRDRTEMILREFDVRPATPELPARSLSGGNQQKLIIGRELSQRPRVLLVSQPTRGVDIGAIEFIYRKLLELRDEGCAILLVSAELEEVTALSDRLLVIHDGRIAGEVDPRRASFAQIGMLMTGGKAA